MDETKEYVADERMKLFFKNILESKQYVKEKSEETGDKTLKEIYQKLDRVMRDPSYE